MRAEVTEEALSYGELKNQLEARTHELETLVEVAHHLVDLELERLLGLILDRLKTIIDYSGAAIWRLDEDRLTVQVYRGPVPQEQMMELSIPVGDGQSDQMAIDPQEVLIIPDTHDHRPQTQAFRAWSGKQLGALSDQIRSWLGVPLIFKTQMIGMLTLYHSRPDTYSAQAARLALTFADYVVVAIENDRLHQQARHLAVLEERNRLAQELHDNVAQALGYVKLKLSTTSELLSTGQHDQVQANLQALKQIVAETYTDIREEIFNLRTATSSELRFLETLRDYVANYQKYYSLTVELVIETEETMLEFPMDVGTQIIRIIQEALINVRKHSGMTKAVIRFRRAHDELRVSVEDSGQGFDLDQIDRAGESGFGLQIMAERAESAGGRLELDTRPGGGVRVIIWMPIMGGR